MAAGSMTVRDIAREVADYNGIKLADAIRIVLDEYGLGVPEPNTKQLERKERQAKFLGFVEQRLLLS